MVHHFNWNKLGASIMPFVCRDILAKLLSDGISFRSFFVELNCRKKKKLLNCPYNHKISNIKSHLNCLSKSIDAHLSKYENIILLVDFNSCLLDSSMKVFCGIYKLCSLAKEATCFENPGNPSCIDLILTDKYLRL